MRIGLANTTMTPDRPIFMTGFASRTEPSEGAYADLEASVVVFDDGERRAGIMSLDLVGVDGFLLEPIRQKAAQLGIAPEAMLVNCSHTHCAPACRVERGSCRKFDEEYLSALKDKLFGLLEQGVDDLQEGSLDYTVGCCSLGINRRRTNHDGSSAGMLPAPAKPIDMDVPVLRVLSADGKVRALLFSYAAHPTTMGGQLIGPDYPGPARDMLREKLPDCLPIFLQGCGGDVKPRNLTADGRFAGGPVDVVVEIGHELARAVLAALCGEPEPLSGSLAAASAPAQLPSQGTPSEQQLAELEKGNQWEQAYAAAVRNTIAEKGGLAEALPVEVQVLRLGDLYLVGMGGEISCEIGLEIKARLAERKVWTLGYSNLLRCYVASLGAHSEGGYEVERSFLYSLHPEPRPLGLKPESVEALVGKAAELVGKL
jgi:neutral ceramidase